MLCTNSQYKGGKVLEEKEPKVSVVIPTLNQGQYIEQAIGSVLGQQYSKIELIIIDGGSTDNTLDVIQKYSDRITYWISEPDSGPPSAINKGFAQATGDIFAWLNSDDFYLPQIFPEIVREIQSTDKPGLIYGGCLFYDENPISTPQVFDGGLAEPNTRGYIPTEFNRHELTYQDFVIQPSAFWTKSLHKLVGEIDPNFSSTFDWEWFIRASKFCDFVPIRKPLSIFRFHSTNITKTSGLIRSREILEIVKKYSTSEWYVIYQDVYNRLKDLINEGELPVKDFVGSPQNVRALLPNKLFEKYERQQLVQVFNNLYVSL